MKLDHLSSAELECYEEWNSSDHKGGDCQTLGYAWAAFDEDRIILIENDQGFVSADTYDATDGTGETAYRRRVEALIKRDEEFFDEQEGED